MVGAQVAYEQEGWSLPDSVEQAAAHNLGDTLADFAVLEMHDLMGDEPTASDIRRAAACISLAIEQLITVERALQDVADKFDEEETA
jgi:hypothetical protein